LGMLTQARAYEADLDEAEWLTLNSPEADD
jgi:hypothetical protein